MTETKNAAETMNTAEAVDVETGRAEKNSRAGKGGKAGETGKTGKKRGGGWKAYLFALVLGAALAAVGMFYLSGRSGGGMTVTSELVAERLEYVGDLVSLEYYYKDAASIDKDQLSLGGLRIPFTNNRAIVTYEGVVKYGVSVRDIGVSVEENRVTLTVPSSKVISHDMPEESVVVFDPGRNLFNPVTIEDFVTFKAERRAEILRQAEERGLPDEARKKAGETLKSFLEAIPGMENMEIVITYKD